MQVPYFTEPTQNVTLNVATRNEHVALIGFSKSSETIVWQVSFPNRTLQHRLDYIALRFLRFVIVAPSFLIVS